MSIGMGPNVVESVMLAGAPRFLTIRGRQIDPHVLFSPVVGESLLFWMAQSLSEQLHGVNLLGVSVRANDSAVSGARLHHEPFPKVPELGDGELVSKAAALMITTETASRILMPARQNPKFDYEGVIVGFREKVIEQYKNGETLKTSDISLHNIVYNELSKPAQQVKHKPNIR
jgi:hypothetical protein